MLRRIYYNEGRSRAITFLMLCIWLWAIPRVEAQVATLQATNDVTQESPGNYRITGHDPYFVLIVKGVRTVDSALSLSLSIEDPQAADRSIPLELFFSASDAGATAVFDPAFRFKFRLPAAQNQTFALPLSPDIALAGGQLARLDIDACTGCLISLNSDLRMAGNAPDSAPDETFRLKDYRLYNGFKTVPADGLEVSLSGWLLHDLELSGHGAMANTLSLSQTGNDPFLISPLLDIKADSFGGVLIELDAPPLTAPATAAIYDFQIFYATEAHAFIEHASSILRLAGSSNITGGVNRLQFLVPLDFLSKQSPPIQVLQRLRFDLPQMPATDGATKTDAYWLLRSVKLINLQQLSHYQHLIPQQLIHSKRQYASRTQTLRGIFKKLHRDPGFVLGYALLMLLVVIITTRKYRKTLKRV